MQTLDLTVLDSVATPLPQAKPLNHNGERVRRTTSPTETLAWCLDIFSGGTCPSDGRNNWLTALALFCNERGVPHQELLDWALNHSSLQSHGEKRITDTVLGNYNRHRHAHGTQAYSCPPSIGEGFDSATGYKTPLTPQPAELASAPFTDTPVIPASVYAALPQLLQHAVAPFAPGRERDVLLSGTLAVLSGCFPGLGGIYDGMRCGANLFVFIIAPAASGKGALRWARAIAAPAHNALVRDSKRARGEYELATAEHATAKRLAPKGAHVLPAPVEPVFRLLFIPGNNSSSGILKMLHENDGQGIICETEADTLSGALKQDWGNFSDLLRKAFHHEPVSVSRKTNREYLEVSQPRLSLALTGTPGQVVDLIPNGENGLFSRVLFYCYDAQSEWRDVGPGGGRGQLDAYYAELGTAIQQLMGHTPTLDSDGLGGVTVELTSAQWARLNATGQRWLSESRELAESENVAGVVFRLTLSMFRVTLLLTLLRSFEQSQVPASQLVAEDADLATALSLGDVYLAHSLALLARMPHPKTGLISPRGKRADKAAKEEWAKELYAQSISIRAIAQQVGIPKSTVERWMKE